MSLSSTRPLDLCIFCLRNDGPFVSEEHILSQSVGNADVVLPPGYVCDPCNNGRLAPLDEALVTYPPIALTSAMRGIRSKRGKMPPRQFASLGVLPVATPEGVRVLFQASKDSPSPRDGRWQLSLDADWSEKDASRVARAVLKSGLEMLALHEGKEVVLLPRYDGVRKAVLNGYRGWLGVERRIKPNDEITTTYLPLARPNLSSYSLGAAVNVYGETLITIWPGEPHVFPNFVSGITRENLVATPFSQNPSKVKRRVSWAFTIGYDDIVDSPWADEVVQGVAPDRSRQSQKPN